MADTEYLVDIASYNPNTNWGATRRNGIVGASIKISQATNYLNPLRGEQFDGARRNGIAPGPYHFGDPRFGARAQAEFFVGNAEEIDAFDDLALCPMYDAENWDGNFAWQSRAQLTDHIGTWLDVLAESTDVDQAFVYGSLSWWTSGMLVPADWVGHRIKTLNWVAVYNGRPGDLQGWNHPDDALHQYTSAGNVDGFPGRVDKNATLRGRVIADLINGRIPGMSFKDEVVELFPNEGDADQRKTISGSEAVGRLIQANWAQVAELQGLRSDYRAGTQALLEAIGSQSGGTPAIDYDALLQRATESGVFDDQVKTDRPYYLAERKPAGDPPSGG